ncbi:MAG: serine protease [Planctomycetes bacterium]|nr:serine protease [Planctomycetota bacterium]
MRIMIPCGLMLAILLASSSGRAQDGAKIYSSGMKSAVMVINVERESAGSGSIVNLKDGYVITNWHVARQAAEVVVMFPLWEKGKPVKEFEAYMKQARKVGAIGKVVATDEKADLAVIKITEMQKIRQGSLPVKFAADSPATGSKIFSIGNPAASDAMWAYTPGEIRNVYKKKWSSGSRGVKIGDHEAMIIEATSPTSPGDSGGPCFNEKGEQVGVTQGGLDARVAQGFSFFIDCTEVKSFLKKNKIPYNQAVDVASPPADPKDVAIIAPPKKLDPAAEDLAKQERAAASMLTLVRPLASDPSRQDLAVGQLNKLIAMYPKTEAAKEARVLLKKIQ